MVWLHNFTEEFHPIIDGVGILKDTKGNYWLLFVIQTYSDHKSNLAALLEPSSYKELKKASNTPCSIFDFYKTFAEGIHNIIYLYVSTSTCFNGMISVFHVMVENSDGKCEVGLISDQSAMYKIFAAFGCM